MLPLQFIYQVSHRNDEQHRYRYRYRYRYIAVYGPDDDQNFWMTGTESSFPKIDGKLALPKGPFAFFPSPPPFRSIEEAKGGAEMIYQQQLNEGWNLDSIQCLAHSSPGS